MLENNFVARAFVACKRFFCVWEIERILFAVYVRKMKVFRVFWIALCVFFIDFESFAWESDDVVIVVLSQSRGYQAALADFLVDKVKNDAIALEKKSPIVVLSHELKINGSWTVFPLLPILNHNHPDAKWFFFCLENTAILLDPLMKILTSLPQNKELWVGHALYDKEPTIIHHFAEHSKKFKYPNEASGFAISGPLLKSLAKRYSKYNEQEVFSIDAPYELATFIYDGGKGVRLSHLSQFCVVSGKDCATFPKFFHPCTKSVSREKIFIAVKTYSKNHVDRIPIIMKTWLQHVTHFGLFSNETDKNLPNIHVVPNTDQGHCAKTRAILEESYTILNENNMDWLVIADDDTIMSMGRLTRYLTCFNPSSLIALGERYGFRVRKTPNLGYDYLTGGAGVVLSKRLVQAMIESEYCDCPSPTAPDDMYLFGYCLNLMRVLPTHSPLFHQARPSDYATAYLASQEPISFHKFWMNDPLEVYENWFAEADRSSFHHTEL